MGHVSGMWTSSRCWRLTLLLPAGALVLGGDVHDAVSIDVEGDLHLGDAPGRGGDAYQAELPQHLVVRGHLSLALAHLDLHLGLSVGRRGEHLQGWGEAVREVASFDATLHCQRLKL